MNPGKGVAAAVVAVVVIGVLAAGVAFFMHHDKPKPSAPPQKEVVPPPPPQEADPRYARVLLENLARGIIFLSVKNGGGGKSNFASDILALKPCIMTKAYDALPGGSGYGGYMARLEDNPAGDGFRSNFLLVAYPAKGYKGASFAIDKSEEVREYSK